MLGSARRYNGTSQYHEVSSAIITGTPCSVYLRIRFPVGASGVFFSALRSGTNNWDGFYGSYGGDAVGATTVQNNDFAGAWTSPAMVRAGRFHDIILVFASPTSRYCIVNGKVPLPANTTNRTPTSTPTMFTLGASHHGTLIDNYCACDIERVGAWNGVLNLSDAAALMRGEFLSVRPRERVDLWPVNGLRAGSGDEGSLLNKNTLLDVGSPLLIRVNAPDRLRRRRSLSRVADAAGAPTVIEWTTGMISFSGQGFLTNRKVAWSAGAVSFAGQAFTVATGRIVQWTTAAISIAGQAFLTNRTVQWARGTVALSGFGFLTKRTIAWGAGAVAFAGRAFDVSRATTIQWTTATISFAGRAFDVAFTGVVAAANNIMRSIMRSIMRANRDPAIPGENPDDPPN